MGDGLNDFGNKFSGSKSAFGAKPIEGNEVPNGTYDAVVSTATLKVSSTGKPMLVFMFTILNPAENKGIKCYGRKLFRNVMLPTDEELESEPEKAEKKGGYLNGDVQKLGIELMRPDEEPNEYLSRIVAEAPNTVVSLKRSTNGNFKNVDIVKRVGSLNEGAEDFYVDKNADTPF